MRYNYTGSKVQIVTKKFTALNNVLTVYLNIANCFSAIAHVSIQFHK